MLLKIVTEHSKRLEEALVCGHLDNMHVTGDVFVSLFFWGGEGRGRRQILIHHDYVSVSYRYWNNTVLVAMQASPMQTTAIMLFCIVLHTVIHNACREGVERYNIIGKYTQSVSILDLRMKVSQMLRSVLCITMCVSCAVCMCVLALSVLYFFYWTPFFL